MASWILVTDSNNLWASWRFKDALTSAAVVTVRASVEAAGLLYDACEHVLTEPAEEIAQASDQTAVLLDEAGVQEDPMTF